MLAKCALVPPLRGSPLFLVTNPGLALRAAAGAIQGGTANAAVFKPWPALPDGLTDLFYPIQPNEIS